MGGGLAGLVSSILLRREGFAVLLLEKKSFPRHKVCGEYISNEARPFLERAGLFPSDFNPPAIHRLRISSVHRGAVETHLKMGGFGISRYNFDHFLYQKARDEGVEVRTNTLVSDVVFKDPHFEITTLQGQAYEAQIVLGAHGKRSILDKNLNRSFMQHKSHYVGVKQHYEADFVSDLVALHNFQGGYAGVSMVEGGRVNFCYLTTSATFNSWGSLAEFEQEHMTTNPDIASFLQSAKPVLSRPLVISQINFEPKAPVSNHVLMCGDAAGLIHPLCGNGMAMAIHAASIASTYATAYLKKRMNRREMEEAYEKAWRRQFLRRLNFGRRVQAFFGQKHLSDWSVAMARRMPKTLKRLVKYSHGGYIPAQ